MLLDVFHSLPEAHVIVIGILFLSILSTFLHSTSVYCKRPKNLLVSGYPLWCGKWLSTFDFLLQGRNTIMSSYEKGKAFPFAIPALREYQVLVSQPNHVQELAQAPKNVLSFHAAMNDRLSHKQIMYGFEHNDVDPHDSVPIHALKVLLRKNLSALGTIIKQRVEEGCQGFLQTPGRSDGVSVFALAKAICARVNNQIIFGDDLATDETFQADSLAYGWYGAISMEICRLLPGPLAKVVGTTIMACSGAMGRVGRRVAKLVDQRLAHAAMDEKTGEPLEAEQYLDCTQFVITASKTPRQRSTERITQQMVALLFASAHQLPMALTWATIMLGKNPHVIPLLREEIETVEVEGHANPIKEMRILDSFLRESSRLNPLDALSVQRKAVKPFTFSDGTCVPAGNLVAVPQEALMRDANNYVDPANFDVFRFYSPRETEDAAQKYTDVNWKYPFWGSPNQSCPGRWYAAELLKYTIVHLLKTYDFELLDPEQAGKPMIWTTAIVPSFGAKISLRLRKQDQDKRI